MSKEGFGMRHYRVEMNHWIDGKGFVGNFDIDCYDLRGRETVDTYINSERFNIPALKENEDYEIAIYETTDENENEVCVDRSWLKENF